MNLQSVTLDVNGDLYNIRIQPRKLLADVLREDLNLTGTHLGCEHGVCGACTVLWDGLPVRSCLIFAVQAEGVQLETVEGLDIDEARLGPIQEAFAESYAIQCGFCTPAFLLTTKWLLASKKDLTENEIRKAISGNICRCTGYHNIIQAIKRAATKI